MGLVVNEMTIWQHMEERARLTPDKVFLRDERGRVLTFSDFVAAAARYALWLQSLGVNGESRVAWQLPTRLEAVLLSAGLCRLGATQVPLLPFLREREVGFICNQAGVDLLIVPGQWGGYDYCDMAASLCKQNARLRYRELPGDADISAVGELEPYRPYPPSEQVSWVFYTSGTTSDPKGAMHCDDAIVSTAFGMIAALEISARDVVPMVFPFTHIGGFIWLASFVITGCECVLVERFSESAFSYMAEAGITIAGAGTAFMQAYLKAQRRQPDVPLFPALRCATGGGSTKPPQLHEQVMRELGGRGMVSGYGMTECPIATMNTVRDPDSMLALSEGRPLPGMQVKIAGSDGRSLPCGEQGEICLKGPHQCRGYIDSDLNRTAFDEEGYLRSGDIGVLNQDGWLTVTGRLKEVIIRKGENISAKKVEDVIAGHGSVAEVAVVGLPDEARGELACAVIELSEHGLAISLTELASYCLEHGLLKQEIPERLEFVQAIPKNASGKVLKEQLKQRYGR